MAHAEWVDTVDSCRITQMEMESSFLKQNKKEAVFFVRRERFEKEKNKK